MGEYPEMLKGTDLRSEFSNTNDFLSAPIQLILPVIGN